jgi:hypothetical protein
MVFYQYRNEERSLHCLRLSNKQDYDSVLSVLDTSQMTSDFLGIPRGRPISLEAECLELRIPYHGATTCAGNNANFSLKVVLMLAVRSQENLCCDGLKAKLRDILREHCRAPLLPPSTYTELEYLRALIFTDTIDGPEVPIDVSRFLPKITKRQWLE